MIAMRIVLSIALAAACAALAACDKGGAGGAAAGGANAVVDAWKQAGLTVSAMTADQSGAIGKDCTAGTVSGVDVVLCKFATTDEAKAAEAKGYEWVGATTGTALAHANMLVVVADRRKADPTGRTINTITKTFRGR
jgi:hypothetical protein